MAFKMKGPSLYRSPLPQKKTKGFGPRAAKGEDDQSKELAKSRYEMGMYKNDPTETDKDVEIREDKEGKGRGSNRKVMNSDPKTTKLIADIEEKKSKMSKEELAKLQRIANDKADKFHKRGKYAVKNK